MENIMELKIYNVEDREKVAAILVKNGYWVAQGKKDSGTKTPDYVLKVAEDPENMKTVKR